jgi:hypothetical protein
VVDTRNGQVIDQADWFGEVSSDPATGIDWQRVIAGRRLDHFRVYGIEARPVSPNLIVCLARLHKDQMLTDQ